MNVLIEDLVQRLSHNDPGISQVSVSRLPLWSVTPAEICAVVNSLQHNTRVKHLEFWLPQEKQEEDEEDDDDDENESDSSDYDFSAIAENTSDSDMIMMTTIAREPPVLDTSFLETIFASNESLRTLEVGCRSSSTNPLNPRAWSSLFEGLRRNKKLQTLALDGSCGSNGDGSPIGLPTSLCEDLALYLCSTSCLKELTLTNIQATSPVALQLLSLGLAMNSTLVTLEIFQMCVPERDEDLDDDDDDDKEAWENAWALLLESLGKIPTLRTLRLIDCEMPIDNHRGYQALESLCQSKSLECLRWIESGLTVSVMTALSQGLRGNNTLRILDLRGNGLTGAHCEPLNMLLQHCPVEKLILDDNLIGDQGIEYLATSLVQLHALNLRCNQITAIGCQYLGDALTSQGARLQVLDLSENAIQDQGAKAVGCSLHKSSLVELVVESCLITDRGVADLVWYLGAKETRLESLSLAQNRITQSGAKSLVEMLALNQSLRCLDLSSCHMSDDSIEVLAQGLTCEYNCPLKELNLAFNAFGNDGAKSLGRLMVRCRLERLECQFNTFNGHGLAAIVHGLSRNYWLMDLFVLSGATCDAMSGPLADQMSHWLALNRAGRRAVLDDSISLSIWPTILERANRISGPPAVYHMLRDRPDLASPKILQL